MTYEVVICSYCRAQVVWDRRGRGPNDFGWYCRNWREEGHPELFHGYHALDSVERIEVVPLPVTDVLAVALRRIIDHKVRAGGHIRAIAENALAKYREALQ
jgi:hypothetical protein